MKDIELPETEQDLLVWALEHRGLEDTFYQVVLRKHFHDRPSTQTIDRAYRFTLTMFLKRWCVDLHRLGLGHYVVYDTIDNGPISGAIIHDREYTEYDRIREQQNKQIRAGIRATGKAQKEAAAAGKVSKLSKKIKRKCFLLLSLEGITSGCPKKMIQTGASSNDYFV